MAHAQKPDFVFRRKRRVHLNQQGHQFSWLLATEVCASVVVMLDTPSFGVVWRVLAPLHLPVSPSLPLLCVTVCHHISTGLHSARLLKMDRNSPKHVEFYSKNKFEKFVQLIGFIIRIYHDARSSECQNHITQLCWNIRLIKVWSQWKADWLILTWIFAYLTLQKLKFISTVHKI
jgi:hypothetical protein